MQNDYSLSQWYQNRLTNYRQRLNLSEKKALKRLMLFTDIEKLRREFDSIVDNEFWSSNEPGLSHQERKKRLKAMSQYQIEQPASIQLSLFNNNKKQLNGTDFKNHRLHFGCFNLFRRDSKTFAGKRKEKQNPT